MVVDGILGTREESVGRDDSSGDTVDIDTALLGRVVECMGETGWES